MSFLEVFPISPTKRPVILANLKAAQFLPSELRDAVEAVTTVPTRDTLQARIQTMRLDQPICVYLPSRETLSEMQVRDIAHATKTLWTRLRDKDGVHLFICIGNNDPHYEYVEAMNYVICTTHSSNLTVCGVSDSLSDHLGTDSIANMFDARCMSHVQHLHLLNLFPSSLTVASILAGASVGLSVVTSTGYISFPVDATERKACWETVMRFKSFLMPISMAESDVSVIRDAYQNAPERKLEQVALMTWADPQNQADMARMDAIISQLAGATNITIVHAQRITIPLDELGEMTDAAVVAKLNKARENARTENAVFYLDARRS
jgi:hypothetical protein